MKTIIIKAVILMVNTLIAVGEVIRNAFMSFQNKYYERSTPEENKLKKYKILPYLHRRFEDYPYPIHDWRNEKLYLKDLTVRSRAWEFFKRNKEYQYDYDRYKFKGHFPEFNIINDKHVTLEAQKRITCRSDSFVGSKSEIEFIHDQIFDYYARLVELKDGTIITLKEVIFKKYGLSYDFYNSHLYNLDPRSDDSSLGFFSANTEFIDYINYDSNLKNQNSLSPINPEHFVMRFNVKENIPKQIIELKKHLNLLSEKHEETHKGNLIKDEVYIKYLRLLDAIASGMNPKKDCDELVKVLAPEVWKAWSTYKNDTHPSSHVEKWLKEAKKLSNYKYLTLLRK